MTRFARIWRVVPWSAAAFIAGCLFTDPSFVHTPLKQRGADFIALFLAALIAWGVIALMTRGPRQNDQQERSWPGYFGRARAGRN